MKTERITAFVEGFFITFNPWLTILSGAMVSLTKRENRYYSTKDTSISFVIGALSGLLCGLIAPRGEYLQW